MAIVPTETAPVGATAKSWQEEIKRAIRDPRELCTALDLPPEMAQQSVAAASEFNLFAPRPFVSRIRPGDPADPLLRQFLPTAEEVDDHRRGVTDPVGDRQARIAPGLLHKYPGRALLIATGACAIHCRYCFRRHYPYHDEPRGVEAWQPALDQLRSDPSIDEIILSGGDPLMLTDQSLRSLLEALQTIPHLRRLRIHTRLPIMIPARITNALIELLIQSRLTPWVVIHCNHAQEIDGEVESACGRLVDSGIPLLNQAVLLRGVNDQADDLIELSRRLIELRVMPYYLHQLDPVAGAAHFHVSDQRALVLIEAIRHQLPGYAVPRLVRETPGERSKTWIG